MSFTYTNQPGSVPRDAVRLRVGDTDPDQQRLSDSEILYFLDQSGDNVILAAAEAARVLAAYYAHQVDKELGQAKLMASQRFKHFKALADLLDRQAVLAGGAGMPYAGGISRSDKENREADTDRQAGAFARGMTTPPGNPTLESPPSTESD